MDYQSIIDNIISSQLRLNDYELGTVSHIELGKNIQFMKTLKDNIRLN